MSPESYMFGPPIVAIFREVFFEGYICVCVCACVCVRMSFEMISCNDTVRISFSINKVYRVRIGGFSFSQIMKEFNITASCCCSCSCFVVTIAMTNNAE